MDKSQYKTAAELRAAAEASSGKAHGIVSRLFDEGTFAPIGTYVKQKGTDGDFEGVVTGYGAIGGRLVYAFVQDYSSGKAALTDAHAEKICALYDMAKKGKAPVIGVFDCAGAPVLEGADAMFGYGKIMKKAARAKKLFPQIAVITGNCGGALSVIASMFDFRFVQKDASNMFVASPFVTGDKSADAAGCFEKGSADFMCDDEASLLEAVRELVFTIPQNNSDGTVYALDEYDPDRESAQVESTVLAPKYDVHDVISALSDDGKIVEVGAGSAKEIVCGFAMLNGKVVSIVANNPAVKDGALTSAAARKAARAVDFASRFDIPCLTLIDTCGTENVPDPDGTHGFALASLAEAYSTARCATVTVITGRAYGSAYDILGGKSTGADMVFALDSAIISPMSPEAVAEFAMSDKIKSAADPAEARREIEEEWKLGEASPLRAARSGEVDDVIAYSELRKRVASAFEMLSFKSDRA